MEITKSKELKIVNTEGIVHMSINKIDPANKLLNKGTNIDYELLELNL